MAESPMVGARVSQDWQQQIEEIAAESGRKEAEVVREAIAQYLGETDPFAINGALASLEDRITTLERKLAFFRKISGLK